MWFSVWPPKDQKGNMVHDENSKQYNTWLKGQTKKQNPNTYITISRNALYNGLKYIYIPYKTFFKIRR